MTTTTREKGSSISRVLEIIEAVSRAERPMSPADLAYQLDIPKPSIHRLLSQLEGDGYLQINMRGLIVPGDRMHDIALGVLHSGRFKAPRQAILKRLTAEIGETCGIAIPNGTEMIYYDRVQTDRPLQVYLPVGSHTPIWCTASGKLYLSSLPRERRQRIINNLPLQRFARNTLTSAAALEAALLKTRDEELGTDDEEFVDGLAACAVPIRGRDGRLFACLFAHAPLIRKSLGELLTYTPLLREAAGELGQLINDTEVVRD
ncbi:IclR family transcriptional regulator [Pseudomonas sp. LPB0260]|uniref:IclR family transcriptional regulator n=1 Tax=Pseudomonas sp. LPB0260 TaxID=2614442 RepID=UPI0015C1DB12|nr:IclR family transcriptional regulator [Pseudomonas sp. LPB0260]QLC73780.1 IclR family transcriptional regulator [Pseudomonas sp. LPB0260]QLC76554.1 IclR family transcriptional regulator [Pseudomonas sp. LPB0260]